MKYDKIGELDGEMLGGIMRGGVVLLRGVWGSDEIGRAHV